MPVFDDFEHACGPEALQRFRGIGLAAGLRLMKRETERVLHSSGMDKRFLLLDAIQ